MPKQTVETFVGVQFDVADGTVTTPEGEQDVRILVIQDGAHSMRFPISLDNADEIGDLLKGSSIVVPKPQIVTVPGTKPGR